MSALSASGSTAEAYLPALRARVPAPCEDFAEFSTDGPCTHGLHREVLSDRSRITAASDLRDTRC